MLGLNVRVDVYARSQQGDDAVGGSVRTDLLRYANVRARIANISNPTVLSMQGFEGKDLHNIILYGDLYPAIEREDIVVPLSGRWAGTRLKVVEVRFSSVLTAGQRAHIQLVAERLRYAHENEPSAAPVAYNPPCTLNGRWAGARFKVVEVRFSSVLPAGQRAHIQLVAERLRYAHENVGEGGAFDESFAADFEIGG